MIKYYIILHIMKDNYVIEKNQKGAKAMKLRYFFLPQPCDDGSLNSLDLIDSLS